MRIAIVGTAGRKDDATKISWPLYCKMVKKSQQLIAQYSDPKDVTIVSGGAAFSDHVSVSLFLMDYVQQLRLYVPVKLIGEGTSFKFEERDYWQFPGNIANHYHRQFSKHLPNNGSSLAGIEKAINKGAVVEVVPGNDFLKRNIQVGNVDYLIAFTFGDGNKPKDGGTSHCWNHSTASQKIHIPLSSLQ